MALRDRQIGGWPLQWNPAMFASIVMVLLVPILGYAYWYPMFNISAELRPFLAVIGMGVQIHRQIGQVPANTERAQLFFGRYTGISFPAGIYMLPKLPLPFVTLVLEAVMGMEIYKYFLWTLAGSVSVQSIVVPFRVEGLTRDNIRVAIVGKLRLEIENAATFISQTGENLQTLIDGVVAEYVAGVKASVISQHTAEELMRGYHSGGASTLAQWMTDAWRLVTTYGVSLESAMIGDVKILSTRMEKAFDANVGKELLRAVSNEYAAAFAEFKAGLPEGTSFEVAANMFNAARLDEGLPPVDLNVFQFK